MRKTTTAPYTIRQLTRTELLVTVVLLLQFITYLFGIFGNPIKAGFDFGRKVENLQTQFTSHCYMDSSWKQTMNLRFEANAADHNAIKHDIQLIKKAVIKPNMKIEE